jgi:uncharacterized protein YjeT (DUF2065 family)
MIQWQDIISALALVMVLEGVFPFLNPSGLRRALKAIDVMTDGQLRGLGLASMLLGIAILYFAKS